MTELIFTNPNARILNGWHHDVASGSWRKTSHEKHGAVFVINTTDSPDDVTKRMAEKYPASAYIETE